MPSVMITTKRTEDQVTLPDDKETVLVAFNREVEYYTSRGYEKRNEWPLSVALEDPISGDSVHIKVTSK